MVPIISLAIITSRHLRAETTFKILLYGTLLQDTLTWFILLAFRTQAEMNVTVCRVQVISHGIEDEEHYLCTLQKLVWRGYVGLTNQCVCQSIDRSVACLSLIFLNKQWSLSKKLHRNIHYPAKMCMLYYGCR